MRPTREGNASPIRSGLVFKGIGFDPGGITEDPEPPTDRAALGLAYIPYLVTGAAALVQSKTNVTAGGAVAAPGVTVTLDAPPTVGNVLVVLAAEDDDSGPAFTLTNGTWTQVGSTVYSGNGTNWPLRMYRQTVTGSTSQTTQVYNAAGGTGSLRAAILELSGVDTVDADIGSASNTATTTDTITPTGSLPAVIVSGAFFRSGTPAPAGSMTELAEVGTTSKLAVNYQEVASTTGSYTVGSTGAGANSSMIAAAFEDTGDAIIWVIAPLTIDDDDATFSLVLEEGIDAASGVFWRGTLDDSYLIASAEIRVGIETAGANTITVQAGNEADYSDAVTVATIPFTATGTYTAQDVADSWTPAAVYRYWQLLLTTTSNVNVYEVALLDPAEPTGAHDDLIGRDAADQHPADAVSFTPAGTIAATNVQDAIEEVAAEASGGSAELLGYSHRTAGSVTTTSGTLADTGIAVTFTAPASTNVLVRLTGVTTITTGGAVNDYILWGVRESTTTVGGGALVHRLQVSGATATPYQGTSIVFVMTGISAGSHTYKWAHAVSTATSRTATLLADGSTPATMEVWAG